MFSQQAYVFYGLTSANRARLSANGNCESKSLAWKLRSYQSRDPMGHGL